MEAALGFMAAIARRGVGAEDWGRFKRGRPGILGVRAQRDPGGDFGRGELRERRLREEGEGPTGGVPAQRDGASASGVPLAGGTGRSG